MSYDIYQAYIKADCPTYNYGGMIRLASEKHCGVQASFGILNGFTGKQSIPWLAGVLNQLNLDTGDISELQPSNGWGTMDGLKGAFAEYVKAAQEYPHLVWRTLGDGEQYDDKEREKAGLVRRESPVTNT